MRALMEIAGELRRLSPIRVEAPADAARVSPDPSQPSVELGASLRRIGHQTEIVAP
jgi:hypothetical protein